MGTPDCTLTPSANQCTAACDGDFGAVTMNPCASATYPVCSTGGSCVSCDSDYEAAGSASCAVGAPYCSATGYCGRCTQDSDCTAMNATHFGVTCETDTGACLQSCVVNSDCIDSAVCDTTDNECGYADGNGPCTTGNAADGGMPIQDVQLGVRRRAFRAERVHAPTRTVPRGNSRCNAGSCTATLTDGAAILNDALHSGTCTTSHGDGRLHLGRLQYTRWT